MMFVMCSSVEDDYLVNILLTKLHFAVDVLNTNLAWIIDNDSLSGA